MSAWVLSLVGVAFIGVVFDVVVPEGKTNAFIKSIFAVFLLFVVVAPLPKIFNKTINISSGSTVQIDKNFIYNINKAKVSALETDSNKLLEKEGFLNAKVTINANLYESEFSILKVYVSLKNLSITEGSQNINKYEKITKILTDYLNVDKGDIVFNE